MGRVRRTRCSRRASVLGLMLLVATLGSLHPAEMRAGITVTPGTIQFDFNYDSSTSAYSFVSFNGNATIDVLGPIAVSAEPSAWQTNWGDLSAWSASATLSNSFAATEAIYDLASGLRSFSPVQVVSSLSDLKQLWQNAGPTERMPSISFPLLGADTTKAAKAIQDYHITLGYNVTTPIRYDVTIPTGANMLMNQQNVIVESLAIQSGAVLTGNSTMTVRTDLTNDGSTILNGGVIEGHLHNTGGITLLSQSLLLRDSLDGGGTVNVLSGGLNVLSPSGSMFELANTVVLNSTELGIGGDGMVSVGGGVVTGSGTIVGNIGGKVLAEGTGKEIHLRGGGGSGGGISYSGSNLLATGHAIARSGGTIRLQQGGTQTNNGLIQAESGGTVVMSTSIALNGTGKVQIDPGGVLSVSGSPGLRNIQQTVQNDGLIDISNSSLRVQAYAPAPGSIRLNNGSITFDQNSNSIGGTLSGTGTITGNVTGDGIVSPGQSPGNITIFGAYTQPSDGWLVLEFSGKTSGQFDTLTITGTAQLGGNVQVSLLNGFVPNIGDAFRVLTYGSHSGTFASLSAPSGYQFLATYDNTGMTLVTQVVPEPSMLILVSAAFFALASRRRCVSA